jgi:predicted regulator of Ras-like GTPase activity (Roadblock/LC7/MglB family)
MNAMVEHELQLMTATFPNIEWICIINVDGLPHPTARFDAGNVRREAGLDKEEDWDGPMSGAILNVSERIMSVYRLGNLRSVTMAGDSGTYFLLPIGHDSDWLIAFFVKGQASVDAILRYFQERDYLASIVSIL